jgi:hypothetical protein
VGEAVRVRATWAGAWPADFAWSGATADTGQSALVHVTTPGDLTIGAGERSMILHVQPGRNTGALPTERPVALPLYDVAAGNCRNDRYPALAGAWVVWCSASGMVDRALDLVSRSAVSLGGGAAAPGLASAAIFDAMRGIWRLPGADADTTIARAATTPIGPPATDGAHGAAGWVDHIEAFALEDSRRIHTDAHPLPGAPVALAWPLAAWVQADPMTGEDVWVREADGSAHPLAREDGDERNVAGDGRWLAWTAAGGEDGGAVFVEDTQRHERRRYAADTGFYSGLGMWGPVACWEDRGDMRRGGPDGVDVRCSDGVEVRRPGDQLHPFRWGPWVLFREDDKVWVATADELVLDDDDPRADDAGVTLPGGYRGAHRDRPVTWSLTWPAPGWRVEAWDGAGWRSLGPLATGAVTIVNPAGDAVRLVREGS